MGQIDAVVKYAKEIEGLLERRFGAEGRGLHEILFFTGLRKFALLVLGVIIIGVIWQVAIKFT
ncbi:MAG: hypothetical protein ACR2P5_08170 [Gammaproteobacteria bacterium]